MEVFNIVAGACSIVGLFVSLFVAYNFVKINKVIKLKKNNKNTQMGIGKIVEQTIGDNYEFATRIRKDN